MRYDLAHYAEGNGPNQVVQEMPWDPMQDFQFMWANTQAFMSLFRAMKPVICKVHGFAVAGGSDIALCADLTIMGATAHYESAANRVDRCGRIGSALRRRTSGPECGELPLQICLLRADLLHELQNEVLHVGELGSQCRLTGF